MASGTGIAPMAQVIQYVLNNENDETFLHLVYGCRSYADIFMKHEIDDWTHYWNFSVLYCLSQVGEIVERIVKLEYFTLV